MDIQQRIDELMKQNNIDSYMTLLRKIFKYVVKNDKYTDVQWAENQKSNFTNMLKGKRNFTVEIVLGLEHVLHTSMDSIINGVTYDRKYQPRGLEYTVACDDFDTYVKLDGETDENAENILKNTDEYNKSLLDYIVSYRAINGIRFLHEKHDFFFIPMNNMFNADTSMMTICDNYQTIPMEIAKLLAEKNESELFVNIFNPFYEIGNYVYENRYLYTKQEFAKVALSSNKIIEGMLLVKRIDLQKANRNLNSYEYDFDEVVFINPVLQALLNEAVNQQVYSTVKRIVDFGYEFNKKQLEFIVEHRNVKQLKNLRVDDRGYLLDCGTKVGNLLVYNEPINPELSTEIKVLLNKLVNQKEEIEMLPEIDYDGGVHKVFKVVDNKYVLKKSSNNSIEYEMLQRMEKIGFLKVPKYYETKEGVDKFEYIHGETFKYKQGRTLQKLYSIINFLRGFHAVCEKELGEGKAYLHGKYDNEDIVYEEEDVKAVINWDNCYVGNPYEDLIEIIFEWTDISSYIRRNEDVLRLIKEIMQVYHQDKKPKCKLATLMKDCLNKKLARIDKTANNYSWWYETIKHSETFIDLYEDELNTL